MVTFHSFQCSVLVEGLLDPAPVQGLTQDSRHMLGDHFFTLFMTNVTCYMAMNTDSVALMMSHAGQNPHRVCSILVALLDYAARNRYLHKK